MKPYVVSYVVEYDKVVHKRIMAYSTVNAEDKLKDAIPYARNIMAYEEKAN